MTTDDQIIPLSRWRAALARARRGHKAEAILSDPEAAKLVPELPVQDLYFAIKEVGLADAEELLALSTPAQVQGFVDLDTWERDRLDVERINAWVEVLINTGYEKLGETLGGLDPEVVALWLQRQARVYDLSIEQPPDEPEGHYYPTPDRFFLLDLLPGGEAGKALERALDGLYRWDLERARQMVMSAKWELASDLEEHAYRWRQGRMADLGYVDFYEALSLYRHLDPTSVRVDERTFVAPPDEAPRELPALLASSLDEGGFFAQALATLGQTADLERLQGALLLLVNKAMAADRVDPGEVEAGRAALSRAVAYLGLGLEYLSRGDVTRGGQALLSIALERVFRVGFSLTLQLRRLAEALVKSGVDPEALEAPWDEVLQLLRQRRPEFPRLLDEPPRTGGRPFLSLAEVSRVASALEELARRARPGRE